VLAANSLEDTNSLADPRKIIPHTTKVDGLASQFEREFPPFSVTVLKVKAR